MIEDFMPHITVGWVMAQQLCDEGIIKHEDRPRITEVIDILVTNETVQCLKVADSVVLAIVDGVDIHSGTRNIAPVMQDEILRRIKERLPKNV